MIHQSLVKKFLHALSQENILISQEDRACVFPVNTKQVVRVFQCANSYGVKIKVISRGENWGYKNDAEDDYVLVKLSKMNKVVGFSEKQRYISVQPGVSFLQAYEFLKKKKSNLMLTMTGGPPNGSIVATTIERGIGKGERGNLFQYCNNLEIVLPNGDVLDSQIQTNIGIQKKVQSKALSGPIFDGIFTQSNLGIVTQMTISLTKKPTNYFMCTFSIQDDKKLPKLIDVIKDLKRDKIIEGNFLIANPYRILSQLCRFPWNKTLKTPLPKKILHTLMKRYHIDGNWSGEFLVSSSDYTLLERKKEIVEKHLKPVVDHFDIIDKEYIHIIKSVHNNSKMKIDESIKERIQNNIIAFEKSPFLGHPNFDSSNSMNWRKKPDTHPSSSTPTAEGIFWFNGVLSFDRKLFKSVVQSLEKIMESHTFEPNLGFNMIGEDYAYLVGVILFDGSSSERIKAKRCLQSINSYLFSRGVYPYRNASLATQKIYRNRAYINLQDKLKKVVDPNGILIN